ncbi:hypothetical protein GCM10010971_02660 [Silvimonas amylolytica]|uniref:Uncharacterized protein n=1 Tax=Silvimonas amylolytica TaxID=449663 RepID=A0ABQ2PFT3_9NEIS|nr:hypothetical protein GCM10010971_02660 [Silvimonas amylolytica]
MQPKENPILVRLHAFVIENETQDTLDLYGKKTTSMQMLIYKNTPGKRATHLQCASPYAVW